MKLKDLAEKIGAKLIGDRTMISGNVTVKDHAKIGPLCSVIGGSAVYEDMAPGTAAMGNPAMPFNHAKRVFLRLKDLPELFHRVKKLEDKLK